MIQYSNNQCFEGNFVHGLKNGSGIMMDSEGKLFLKATWRKDSIVGAAEIFMSNNDYYIG